MRFNVILNEEQKEIEVTRQGENLRISYDGQTFEARLIHTVDAHFVLEVEEMGSDGFICRKRIRAAGCKKGDYRQLWANGRLVNYRVIRQGAAKPPDDQTVPLSATIPAVVSEILIQVGQTVNVGDKLILLESMKMIIPIQAPYEGTVSSIYCAPGEAVQPGRRLVEIERQI